MELMDRETARLGPGEGKALRVFGEIVTRKVAAGRTGGAYSLFEVEVPPDAGPPPHVQHHEDECLYVVAGEFELLAEDESMRMNAGSLAYIPKGTLHAYKNVGSFPGRLLAVHTPGGIHEGFFEEIVGEADIGGITAVAARHGIEVPPPPGGGEEGGSAMADKRWAVVPTGEGEALAMGGFGVVHKLSGADTGGAFSVVEHPMEPGVLGAPPHTHANEDEYSYVAEGEIGVWIGGEEFRAKAGDYVLKPRGVPHAFWNPGPGRARVVEMISPAGLETYFDEVAAVIAQAEGNPPDFAKISEVAGRYGLVFHMEMMPDLMERHKVELR